MSHADKAHLQDDENEANESLINKREFTKRKPRPRDIMCSRASSNNLELNELQINSGKEFLK